MPMTFPVRGWLQKPGFRTSLRVGAVILVAYAIMLIANVSPPKSETQCAWVFPKIVSCLLGTNLAGGMIGAGGGAYRGSDCLEGRAASA